MKQKPTKTAAGGSGMEDKVYKIFTEAEWNVFQQTGQFNGSADDLRDGFIHLSTKQQVDGVIGRFFKDKRPLYVAEFSGQTFIQGLTWEASAANGIYPHLYAHALFKEDLSGFVKV